MTSLNLNELLNELKILLNNNIRDEDINKFIKVYCKYENSNDMLKITSYMIELDNILLKKNDNKKPFSLCELIDILERHENTDKKIFISCDHMYKSIINVYVDYDKIIFDVK